MSSMEFREIVRDQLERSGLERQEAATYAGISKPTLNEFLAGGNITFDFFERVCLVLDLQLHPMKRLPPVENDQAAIELALLRRRRLKTKRGEKSC